MQAEIPNLIQSVNVFVLSDAFFPSMESLLLQFELPKLLAIKFSVFKWKSLSWEFISICIV